MSILSLATSVSPPALPVSSKHSTEVGNGISSIASGEGKSPIAQLTGYLKNSITRTVDGCGQLWTNHKTCNTIRAKLQHHRDDLAKTPPYARMELKERKKALSAVEAGIEYEEYMFLQKGKEDRGKLMNVVFLMWGAPRFLPYALMFNPEMLPSPFLSPGPESVLEKKSRQRSTAVLECLLQLEQQAKAVPALSKLNIFGGKKQQVKMNAMHTFNERVASFLISSSCQGHEGASRVLQEIGAYLYLPVDEDAPDRGDFSRKAKRLCDVPPTVIKGLGSAIGNAGFFASVSPNFLNRGKILGHVKKIADADHFLVQANIDLTTISWRLLQEACSDRLIGNAASTPDELQSMLSSWLRLVVYEPAKHDSMHFNSNLARTSLMGYHALQATRDGRSDSAVLPRLLFAGDRNSVVSGNGMVQSNGNGSVFPRASLPPREPESFVEGDGGKSSKGNIRSKLNIFRGLHKS
jgi:hypothetical protein